MPFVGDVDRGVASSAGAGLGSTLSARTPSCGAFLCVSAETWKKDEEALLAVALRIVPPEGRLGSSFSLVSGVFSFSLALLLVPNESFDVFLATERRVVPVSSEPLDARFRCLCSGERGVAWIEAISIEGMWIHSKPVFVSRYWTCIRSRTRRISALIAAGDLVDVVATLLRV